ncbi:MAG: ribosome-binding factor A [Candidatus Andersenbacteria bacterium]|nr:ribosome-binding factor A [Candidatus Andersenbacteria bacterium]
MNRRLDRINERIHRTFGEILQREADLESGVLVTVTRVQTSVNRRAATVWLSVWPAAQAAVVVAELRANLYALQGSLNRALQAKVVPRVRLEVDTSADDADRHERNRHAPEPA